MDREHQPETPGARHGADGKPTMGIPNAPPACPADSQIFAFYENRLQFWERRNIERHLANCDSCRESVALLQRLHGETEHENETVSPDQQGDVDMAQVARVLAYIERSDAGPRPVRPVVRRTWLPAPAIVAMAAFLVLALGAFVVYKLYLSESSADAGLEAVANAVRKQRRTPVLPSRLPYSPYASGTRGGPGSDDLQFQNAENKLRFALDKSAPAEARLNLARLYLARFEGPDAENALTILQELAASGIQSADVLNDTGAAMFGSGRYAEAIDYFNKALAANPRMSEALFNKAVAEQQAGDGQSARQDYQKFIDSSSNQEWIKEARDKLKSIS